MGLEKASSVHNYHFVTASEGHVELKS